MELTAKVLALYNGIVENDLLEDRREYSVDDLMTSLDIGVGEALELHLIIQANFTAESEPPPNEMFASIKTIVGYPGMQVKRALAEYIEESDFQGWEGYTVADIGSINAFLKDLALAMVSSEGFEGMGQNDDCDVIYGISQD